MNFHVRVYLLDPPTKPKPYQHFYPVPPAPPKQQEGFGVTADTHAIAQQMVQVRLLGAGWKVHNISFSPGTADPDKVEIIAYVLASEEKKP